MAAVTTTRPTTPLPSAARAAMRRLELALSTPEIVRAVTRYEIATARYDELNAKPASALKPAEVDAIGDAQQTIAEAFGVLAEAGRLDLIAPDEAAMVEKVRVALGLRAGWRPNAHFGETATYLTMWSQMELNDLFERVGGTATTRQVERSTHYGDATWIATEITLTVDVPGVGPVEVVTDIEDDPEHGYRTDVPVVAVARYEAASAHCQALSAANDFDGCLAAQDEMAMCRCQLATAGRLDLIGAA